MAASARGSVWEIQPRDVEAAGLAAADAAAFLAALRSAAGGHGSYRGRRMGGGGGSGGAAAGALARALPARLLLRLCRVGPRRPRTSPYWFPKCATSLLFSPLAVRLSNFGAIHNNHWAPLGQRLIQMEQRTSAPPEISWIDCGSLHGPPTPNLILSRSQLGQAINTCSMVAKISPNRAANAIPAKAEHKITSYIALARTSGTRYTRLHLDSRLCMTRVVRLSIQNPNKPRKFSANSNR